MGLAVGSFASVSLDPPLVGFFPARASSTWPRIEATGRFCVNVLSEEQLPTCLNFAVAGGDKFSDVEWRPTEAGNPILSGVLAWIDCRLNGVTDAGDHVFVLGEVVDLHGEGDGPPLVFSQGSYPHLRPRAPEGA